METKTDIFYGIRSYKTSEKTKRPQKNTLSSEKLEKRNSSQRRLYISLDNIDEMFSNNDKWPICYDLLFNLIQGKVTKFFKTRNYDRKKEVSYDCINRLYSVLKRKLLKLKADGQENPTLFFFLSQFFRYVESTVFSTVFYGTQDQRYLIQEPDNFMTENVLHNSETTYYQHESESEWFSNRTYTQDGTVTQDYIKKMSLENEEELERYLQDPNNTIEDFVQDNSSQIKLCIENNEKLDNKEKSALFRLYKNCYSSYGLAALTKRDREIIQVLALRSEYEPDLLGDLKEILNGERKSSED